MPIILTEEEIIFADKMQRYVALGLTVWEAERLAERNDVDWHYVKNRLIDRGCDPHLAFEIVV